MRQGLIDGNYAPCRGNYKAQLQKAVTVQYIWFFQEPLVLSVVLPLVESSSKQYHYYKSVKDDWPYSFLLCFFFCCFFFVFFLDTTLLLGKSMVNLNREILVKRMIWLKHCRHVGNCWNKNIDKQNWMHNAWCLINLPAVKCSESCKRRQIAKR